MTLTDQNSLKKVWGIGSFHFLAKFFLSCLMFFWAIFYSSIGFSGTQIGIIFAASSITSLITITPSGFINDKIKSKTLISLGLLFLAAQFLGSSQTTSFVPMLILSVIGTVGYYLYSASIDSIFYKTAGKENTTKKIGIYQSLTYFGLGLGAIASGQMLELNMNFKTILLITGSGLIIASMISQFLPKTISTDFEIVKYKSDLLKPKVLFFLFIIFLFSLHFGAENTSYGLFLEKTLGLQKLWIGLYMGFAIFLMGFWTLIFSKLIKKITTKSFLVLGLALSSIGHILMAIPFAIANPIFSFLFRVLHEAGDAAMFMFFAYGITKFFAAERVGGNNGIITFVMIIGGAISNLIFGPLGEKYGYDMSLIVTGVVLAFDLLLAMIFSKMILSHEDKDSITK